MDIGPTTGQLKDDLQLWDIAQLAERTAVNREVGGSKPPVPVNKLASGLDGEPGCVGSECPWVKLLVGALVSAAYFDGLESFGWHLNEEILKGKKKRDICSSLGP